MNNMARAHPRGLRVQVAQGLGSPGPEGVPIPSVHVTSQSGFPKVPGRGWRWEEASLSVVSGGSEGRLPTTPEGSKSPPHLPISTHRHTHRPPAHTVDTHTHTATHTCTHRPQTVKGTNTSHTPRPPRPLRLCALRRHAPHTQEHGLSRTTDTHAQPCTKHTGHTHTHTHTHTRVYMHALVLTPPFLTLLILGQPCQNRA